MHSLLQDLRYGLRQLRRNSGFTAVAVITLALGIGANTTIFSLVDALILHPLPYPQGDRLVHVWQMQGPINNPQDYTLVSPPNFMDIKQQNHVFEGIAAVEYGTLIVNQGGAQLISRATISPDLLPVLRIPPVLGRNFTNDEQQPGHDRVIILNYHLWRSSFGGDPKLVGKTVTFDGEPYTVVGILPLHFHFPGDYAIDALTPLALTPKGLSQSQRASRELEVIGRLKKGVSLQQAQVELATIARRLEAQYPIANKGLGLRVVSLHGQYLWILEKPLLILLAAVTLVLFIACANVANLMLTRSSARHKEVAVRVAVGATRARLIRQFLTESTLLALMGGGMGLLIVVWGTDVLGSVIRQVYNGLPGSEWIGINGHVLAFAIALSFITVFLFGLLPALKGSTTNLNVSLKENVSSTTTGTSTRHLRASLIVCEIGLAMVLAVGAGLLIRTFVHLLDVKLGFNPRNLLTMEIMIPSGKYSTPTQRAMLYERLLSRLQSLPGVQSDAASTAVPFWRLGGQVFFNANGNAEQPSQEGPTAMYDVASRAYFRTMGVPLLQGRYFNRGDSNGSAPVCIVNESLAHRYWPKGDAIGHRLRILSQVWGKNNGKQQSLEVVGVVRDFERMWFGEKGVLNIFVPFEQAPASSTDLLVRSAVPSKSLITAIRRTVQSIDNSLPLTHIETEDQLVSKSYAGLRFPMLLVWIFATLALALAAVGVFGVISYSVSQRTHEMAIRFALGATRQDILELVLKRGLFLALLGVCSGLIAALALGRIIASYLYGVKPRDPLTFIAVSLVLFGITLLASYLPARRATKVDPMVALRYE
jgi:predicted permease